MTEKHRIPSESSSRSALSLYAPYAGLVVLYVVLYLAPLGTRPFFLALAVCLLELGLEFSEAAGRHFPFDSVGIFIQQRLLEKQPVALCMHRDRFAWRAELHPALAPSGKQEPGSYVWALYLPGGEVSGEPGES